MIGKVIDVKTWDSKRRDVLYRHSTDHTYFGEIVSMRIESDGFAIIHVKPHNLARDFNMRAQCGPDVGQWQFITPLPEVQELIEILTGRNKPGAPLPELEKGANDGSTTHIASSRARPNIDVMAERSATVKRETAVKDTRL